MSENASNGSGLNFLWLVISFACGASAMFYFGPVIPREWKSSEFNRGVEYGRYIATQEERDVFNEGVAEGKRMSTPIDMDQVLRNAAASAGHNPTPFTKTPSQ